ncbi:MAG TPA: hypothetical protein VGR63_19060 [Casimicrobiaceae bacterium]|jgi:hypothetical protein|nr:hypothetical protein [Casimicrobiaceae bacterium]
MGEVVVTLNEQIDELKRELKQRERVYPRLVAQGKLRQAIADYQVARMQAALATVERVKRLDDALVGMAEPRVVQ